jgi:pimeloyl-ACP methyl ester carboxylesterase
MDNHVPVGTTASIKITSMEQLSKLTRFATRRYNVSEITPAMRFGVKPTKPLNKQQNVSAEKYNVINVHGYCADVNPWAGSAAFSSALKFLDPLASKSNDDFAAVVIDYVVKNELTSFSLVGHSQGGMIGSHLLNWYWSGLDEVPANRRFVQAVGTPFKGCSAAGSTAKLGELFGIACGENYDLTPDGAKAWEQDLLPEVWKERRTDGKKEDKNFFS